MTDDSESDFGSAGTPPVPVERPRRAGGDSGSFHTRPFNAWASKHEQKASLWTRIARLFGRRGGGDSDAVEQRDAGAESSGDDASLASDPVTPPADFTFPWTRPEDLTAPVTGTGALDDDFSFSEPAERTLEERRPDLPYIDDTFDSVDAALPRADRIAGEPPGAFEVMTEADSDPVPEPSSIDQEATQEVPRPPGLIARLLRLRKDAELPQNIAAPRTSDEINPVFLVSKFRAFYNEILTQKHQGSDITSGFATAILSQDTHDETPDVSAEQAAQTLSARLHQMLELQHAEATWMGGETAARYPDAQYAMAVLGDETLATLEWKGRSAWPQHSLEMKLYRSNAADLEFFRRVDRLFKERQPTVAARDLARVYLLTIAAGFRGKYGIFGLSRALHEYRQRLYEFVYDGDALLLYADDRKIFPEAASRTIAGKAMSRFSGAQRWVAILVAVLIGYTVLAHMAWNRASADLRDVTARVQATNAATGVR